MESTISPELIKIIIAIVLIIMVVAFLIKKAIKVALSIVAILLIFQTGYMLTGTDMENKFNISQYFRGDIGETLISVLDDFDSRRDELAIVDEEKVYDGIVDGIGGSANFIVDNMKKVDYVSLSLNIADKLYDLGVEHIDSEQLGTVLKDQLNSLSKEDIDKITNAINKELSKRK